MSKMSRPIEASLEKGLDEFCVKKTILLKPSRPGETRDSIILKGGSRGASSPHPRDLGPLIKLENSRLVEAGLDTGPDGFCIVKTIDFVTFLKCRGPSRPATRRASISFALKEQYC